MVLVLWVKILWNTKGFEIQKHRILKIFNFKTFKVECFRKIYINSECIFPFFKTACNISCKMKYGMFSWVISLKSKLFFIKNAVYKLYYCQPAPATPHPTASASERRAILALPHVRSKRCWNIFPTHRIFFQSRESEASGSFYFKVMLALFKKKQVVFFILKLC